MKRSSLLILILVTLWGCKDNTKFVIEGNITNAPKAVKVYLYDFRTAEVIPVDSTVMSDNGSFRFERTAPELELFRIVMDTHSYMIIAQNGDKIKLAADANSMTSAYTLEGSEEAENMVKLNAIKTKYNARLDKIQEDFNKKVEADETKREEYVAELLPVFNGTKAEESRELLKFANENSNSLVSFYAINLLVPDENEAAMVAYADKISNNFKGNAMIDEFKAKMTALKRLQVGQIAPDIATKTPDGKPIALKDLRGKYVLLDFWASWCQPCRLENPNIVKAYNAYKDKNFTVFGVSLDKDRSAWLQAIKADGLTWSHGSDGTDFEGQIALDYRIESIPTSYLLDPQGKILAKNLRGAELEKFLANTIR